MFSYRDSVSSAAKATLFAECLLLPLGIRVWRLSRELNNLQ